MLTIKTVLFPTDFSTAAEPALHVATSLAREHGARMLLLNVPPPPAMAPKPYWPETEFNNLVEASQIRLNELASTIHFIDVETHVAMGDPGAAIVNTAERFGADIIVMGTHGRTGLSRLLLGSVAEYVLRHARCPVLTIKPGATTLVNTEPAPATATTT